MFRKSFKKLTNLQEIINFYFSLTISSYHKKQSNLNPAIPTLLHTHFMFGRFFLPHYEEKISTHTY